MVSAGKRSGGTDPSLCGDGSAHAPGARSDPARCCGSGWGWSLSPSLLAGVRMKPAGAVQRVWRSTGEGLGPSPGSASAATRSPAALPLSQGDLPSVYVLPQLDLGVRWRTPHLSHPFHPTLQRVAAPKARKPLLPFTPFNLLTKKTPKTPFF